MATASAQNLNLWVGVVANLLIWSGFNLLPFYRAGDWVLGFPNFPKAFATLIPMVKNVLGTALQTCCTNPLTGFYRDGKCNTGPDDHGQHTICVNLTDEFLQHQRAIGNDLITPRPEFGFPGLKAGDHWCVCIERWRESYEAGVIGPPRLEATHEKALEFVTMEMLLQSADMGKSRVN